ncbi:Transposon TX1 uncharacterized 149 kDa protein [Linum perenne]
MEKEKSSAAFLISSFYTGLEVSPDPQLTKQPSPCVVVSDASEDEVSFTDSDVETFKYFRCWEKDAGYEKLLHDVWLQGRRCKKPFHNLYRKLHCMKAGLKRINAANFSAIHERVKSARSQLLVEKNKQFHCPSPGQLLIVNALKFKMELLQDVEESISRAKSRALWIKEGKKCTKFFHDFVKGRNVVNTIRQLADANIVLVSDRGSMEKVLVEFYTGLLGTEVATKRSDLASIVHKFVTADQSDLLEACVTESEVRIAVFSMPNDNAPGSDGFTAGFYKRNWKFYKRNWKIVGKDVTNAILSFFHEGVLPPFVNSVSLSLIPMKLNAIGIRDYRPISCCNVIYKIITKILALSLRDVLPSLIDTS